MERTMKHVTLELLLVLAVALAGTPEALATIEYQSNFTGLYIWTQNTKLDSCDTCHSNNFSGTGINPYGADMRAQLLGGATVDQSLKNIETLDSDGDSYSNIIEISNFTFPGNSSDYPWWPVPTPVLTTITVSPANASVVVRDRQNFTASTLDQYGNPFPATVTWTSSNTTVGTIYNAPDGIGVFDANAVGTTTITATNGTVSGTATAIITLPPPVLTTIMVSPENALVVAGSTQTFTAYPKDQYGNPFPATVTWTSSNTTVGTIDSTGLFYAAAAGTTTITAANGTVSGTATATVRLPAVTFEITDSVNGLPIMGASVSMDGIKIITDVNGRAVFTNVALGSHNYAVSKTGYRRTTGVVSVAADTPVPVKLVAK